MVSPPHKVDIIPAASLPHFNPFAMLSKKKARDLTLAFSASTKDSSISLALSSFSCRFHL
ncbi:hypothetical protein HMPREF1985_01766 [Mitsuokella sp. oral taxon 131 str. W9106]|nr:hypothetical protein HMPREF1985_01766 [Mitsuokella sp. oral taxon 131 str. W9106]